MFIVSADLNEAQRESLLRTLKTQNITMRQYTWEPVLGGHTRFVGRATQALQAIEELSDQLMVYQVIVYSADPKAKDRKSVV